MNVEETKDYINLVLEDTNNRQTKKVLKKYKLHLEENNDLYSDLHKEIESMNKNKKRLDITLLKTSASLELYKDLEERFEHDYYFRSSLLSVMIICGYKIDSNQISMIDFNKLKEKNSNENEEEMVSSDF